MTTDSENWELPLPDVTLRGRRCGAGGPLLALLHGAPGVTDYFASSDVPGWLASRYAVITYDQRGGHHSPSSGPFSIQAAVSDLEAIRISQGSERMTLVGHSSGALLAVHYAAAHPGRVERLVLVSPAGVRSNWRHAFDAEIKRRVSDADRERMAEIDGQISRERDAATRQELYRQRFNVALRYYVDPAYEDQAPTIRHFNREAHVRVNGSLQAIEDDPSWRDALSAFRGPVAIIHGRSDPVPWIVVDDLVELLPRAVVFPLERCGHFPWLEIPDLCRAVLDAALAVP